MNRSRISGIYAITPEMDDTTGLVTKVSAALAGGVRLVQYRNKNGSAKLRRYQCEAVLERVQAVSGTLIVNDDPQLAVDVRVDGVHLGKDDGTVANARRLLGPDKIIGVSCYNDLSRARQQEEAGADYVAFGSFFPSKTKPAAVSASLDLLLRAKSLLTIPMVAIGGIERNNAKRLLDGGADAVAVLSALFCVDDVVHEARAFTRLSAPNPAISTIETRHVQQ